MLLTRVSQNGELRLILSCEVLNLLQDAPVCTEPLYMKCSKQVVFHNCPTLLLAGSHGKRNGA